MQIKSRKTKLTHTVTDADWENMKKQGIAKNFDVVSTQDAAQPSAPAELGIAFADHVKTADAAYKAKDYKAAQASYTAAKAIKSSKKIEERLAELSDLVE